ncbi:ribonuclease H-like domain-containing protein [Tanacetum coccineum]
MGDDSDHPTDSTPIPIIDQPSSSSQPKKDKPSKKAQRQGAEVPQDEAEHKESVPTPSNDPQPSGEDSMQLTKLMVLCTKLQTQVLDLQKVKNAQAKEIAALKKRIQRLERRKMSRPIDASKQGRSIEDIDDDVDVSLVDETQERQNDDLMFDSGVLEVDVMHVEAKVDGKYEQSKKPDDSTAGEAVTTASIDDSAVPTTNEEITLAQTLIQIKAAKPKVVTTAATTTTTTRPKDRGVVVQEPSEFRVPQEIKPSSSKDKGKGIMIEPEVPLKRKDQIALDEQIARDIQAKLDAELLEEQKLARKQEEEANIVLIESWENTQAMMEADRLLAKRLQSKEREELTDEEKTKLFMELMEKRRKHFAALRAQEKRNRPPTKAQKRTQMSTYLKHMGGYTYKQLKGKSFDEIQKLFDKEMKRVNTFVAMGSESEEVEEDDEVKLKKLLVIKKDEDIAIDDIPLATKLPVIIDYKLHKEGMLVHYELIRADRSSKRYSLMIRMFEPGIKSDVWRMLQGYRVTTWKLIDSSGVHFVRFDNLHIFMLVERRYPLTPITITNMLNKKLQTDHQNEMCYQLLKLMIQKMNIKFRGGLLGLKRLHGFLEVTAAQVHNGNYAKWIKAYFQIKTMHSWSEKKRQEEGIDYEEVFAPVQEFTIRFFSGLCFFKWVFLYCQMDIKSAFLYGTIEKEVYVTQPPRFKDPDQARQSLEGSKHLYGFILAPSMQCRKANYGCHSTTEAISAAAKFAAEINYHLKLQRLRLMCFSFKLVAVRIVYACRIFNAARFKFLSARVLIDFQLLLVFEELALWGWDADEMPIELNVMKDEHILSLDELVTAVILHL